MSDQTYGAAQDLLARYVEIGVPLLVRRKCTHYHLSCWLAVRMLIDVLGVRSFGSRDVAREMNTRSYPRVASAMADLLAMGLIKLVGTEEMPGGLHDRGVYAIPWEHLLEESIRLALRELGEERRYRRAPPPPPAEQLQLDMLLADGTPAVIARLTPAVAGAAPPSDSAASPTLAVSSPGDATSAPTFATALVGEQRGPASRAALAEIPRAIPTSPPADAFTAHPQWRYCGPLVAHPLALWGDSTENPTRMDLAILSLYAGQHDAPTGGYGWYWVGVAITMLASGRPISNHRAVKVVLDSWQVRDAYGADRSIPTEAAPASPPTDAVPEPEARRRRTYDQQPARGRNARDPRGRAPDPGAAPHSAERSDEPSDEELASIERGAADRVTNGRQGFR
jgi:hypothetical protein